MKRFLLSLVAACILLGCKSESTDSPSAGASGQGPALQVPDEQLQRALTCHADLTAATSDPVLLTPAFSTDQESFGWNYLRQLTALGIPVCSLSLPDRGFGDLQNAAEHVVHAVRSMSAQSGRKVILFGHQHGPLDELWALKFWPDLPGKVSSLIALATPFNGTDGAAAMCGSLGRCAPSLWQIATGSRFLTALNAAPLPRAVAYTSITTLYDELIVPQPQASRLEGATNIVLQDICPGRLVEHFTILADNLAYELVLDAINHPGQPADPARLPPDICSAPLYMPGTDNPENAVAALMGASGFLSGFVLAPFTQGVAEEPAVRSYAATE